MQQKLGQILRGNNFRVKKNGRGASMLLASDSVLCTVFTAKVNGVCELFI